MNMQLLGRWLIGAGIGIFLLGVAFRYLPGIPYLGRLPGDILIKRDKFTFYFPLTTCILISIILMLTARFFGRK